MEWVSPRVYTPEEKKKVHENHPQWQLYLHFLQSHSNSHTLQTLNSPVFWYCPLEIILLQLILLTLFYWAQGILLSFTGSHVLANQLITTDSIDNFYGVNFGSQYQAISVNSKGKVEREMRNEFLQGSKCWLHNTNAYSWPLFNPFSW